MTRDGFLSHSKIHRSYVKNPVFFRKSTTWICFFGDCLLYTMSNHSFSPPFSRVFLELFPSIVAKQIEASHSLCMWWFPGLPSLKLTARPWKWMVRRRISFWDGPISGAMLVSGRVFLVFTRIIGEDLQFDEYVLKWVASINRHPVVFDFFQGELYRI